MSEIKTRLNDKDLDEFLNSIENRKRSEDTNKIIDIMKKVTSHEPKMWGDSIIGFDTYHYKYKTGREGDWLAIGVAPRKQNISLYLMNGFNEYEDLLSKLGKHKVGKACLYINKIEDINIKILEELIAKSYKSVKEMYKE